MNRKVFISCMAGLLAMTLTGCGVQTDFSKPQLETEISESGITVYNTDSALGPLEYSIAVNKEIGVVMNILEGHMANGKNVADGNYPVKDEQLNLASSLDVVQEAIDSVDTFNPPKDYEDERLTVLQKLTNAQNTLLAYQGYLDSGDMNSVKDAIELMEGDFAALKSSYNNFNE